MDTLVAGGIYEVYMNMVIILLEKDSTAMISDWKKA